MGLLELPEEVLIMIMNRLELKSKLSVALTCTRLADVLCLGDVIGNVSLTRSAFPIPLLKHRGFFRIAPHIRHLDLSGVPHLDTAWLLPLLTRMRGLQSLNVSMTNIVLLDLLDVCEQCVNLTRLTVNYWHLRSGAPRINNARSKKRAFRRLEYVHLYGVTDYFFNFDAMRVLQNPKLAEFRITAIQLEDGVNAEFEPYSVSFGKFPIKLFNVFVKDGIYPRNLSVYSLPLIEGLARCGWEYISLGGGYVRTMSPNFEASADRAIKETLQIKEMGLEDITLSEIDNIFMWHPEIFSNDPMMYSTVLNTLNKCRPQLVCGPTCFPDIVSIGNSFLYISPNNYIDHLFQADINIEHIVRHGGDMKLAFVRMCHIYPRAYNPLEIGSNADTYRNIVYLHFDAEQERYLSSNFCIDLFKYCNRLETLYYDNEVRFIQDALVHSKSLKNLMVFNKIKQPSEFVRGVANCKSLENVHICDGSFSASIGHMEYFDAGLSEVVENCVNMYNFEYHAAWGKHARHKQLLSILRVLKKQGRDVRIDLAYYDRNWSAYLQRRELNPYLRIFLGHDYYKVVVNSRKVNPTR